MNEIWKNIKGYEGLYQVSNLGRVKNVRTDKILKQHTARYSGVKLCKEGVISYHTVHKLMMEAFVPNSFNLPCINHKDEKPWHNYIHINEDGSVDPDKSNLEWCTQKYNVNYGTGIERCAKQKHKPVLQFSSDGVFIKEYPSIKEAAEQTGIVSPSNIGACCRGIYAYAGGFIWRYKDAS